MLNSPNSISAGASPEIPLGELTALPRPSGWIKGSTSKGKEGKEWEKREEKGRGDNRGEEGKGKGRKGSGGDCAYFARGTLLTTPGNLLKFS